MFSHVYHDIAIGHWGWWHSHIHEITGGMTGSQLPSLYLGVSLEHSEHDYLIKQ